MQEPWVILQSFRQVVTCGEWSETFITTGMCVAEGIQWVFRAQTREGYHEREKVSCPCCGGELLTFVGDSEITTSDNLEVVGCLVGKGEILYSVLYPTASEMEKDALRETLGRHDLTASYSLAKLIHAPSPLSLTLKPHKKNSPKSLLTPSVLSRLKTENVKLVGTEPKKKKDRAPKNLATKKQEPTPQTSSKHLKESTKKYTSALLASLKKAVRGPDSSPSSDLKQQRKRLKLSTMGHSSIEHTSSQDSSCPKRNPSTPNAKTSKISFELLASRLYPPKAEKQKPSR